MKIAIAQTNPKIGDIPQNLKRILENSEKAKKLGASLVVFPELSIVGYPPRDLLDYPRLVDENLKALDALKAVNGIAILCGYVEKNPEPIGKPYYNAVAFIENGEIKGRYFKHLLPYYDVFEDERYFEAGNEGLIFSLGGKKVGVTVCEDMWSRQGFIRRPYATDPLRHYEGKKIDVLVNLSASPFHIGKPEVRETLFKGIAKRVNASVVFCNQVGANDELLFDGSSFAVTENAVIARLPAFQESLQVIDTDSPQTLTPTLSCPEETYFEALKMGIRDYVVKCGQKKVCLGLSGGIDSTVVAVLAKEALGAENVLGVCLPTRFSSKGGLDDAIQLAKNLGISHKVIPIESYLTAFETGLKKEFTGKMASLTLENLQPRIRMTVLMAFSNETQSLLLNTSNKSEIATGFATLYGDTAGALGVLGDLTKREVYALAKWMNRSQEVIPVSIIARVPSAELKENQADEDVLPPYKELDTIVAQTMEEFRDPRDIPKGTVSSKSVSDFIRLHALSEYKRRQLPPVLRLSRHAFGMGRRFPVVSLKPFEL